MSGALGPVSYETEPNSFLGQVAGPRRLYSEETAREIDVAIREVVEDAFRRARAILERNRTVLDEGARKLLQQETLAGDDLAAILGRVEREGLPVAAASAV
jgi:cell division protease FtsH